MQQAIVAVACLVGVGAAALELVRAHLAKLAE